MLSTVPVDDDVLPVMRRGDVVEYLESLGVVISGDWVRAAAMSGKLDSRFIGRSRMFSRHDVRVWLSKGAER